jgi:hemerythrin-like domain-containing protein
MLRDKNLIPLSHQHQHALALCVRIDRASPIASADLVVWQAEIAQIFQTEITFHFAAEEKVLFPAARNFGELHSLVDELLGDHGALRKYFARAEEQQLSASDLLAFAQRMSAHIRKEERQLFERMQELMNPEQLALLGRNLEDALKDATQACSVPTEVTKLRSAK